jgi:tetratricopeptide (TPR) repeat protein
MNKPGNRDIGELVALVNENRFGEAENRARSLLGLHPEAGILWKILGVSLMRQRKEALQALHRAASLMPQDAEAHSNLGSALYGAGQYADALVHLRRALQFKPNDTGALVDAANALKELGQFPEAVTLYQEALRLDRRQPEALNNLGNALMALGERPAAMKAYRFALELAPDEAQIHFNLGNALRQSGEFLAAIASSERAIALDGTLARAHNNLGLSLLGLKRREEAIASFRQALTQDGAQVEVLNNLGNALRDIGECREAAALYRRAIEIDPLHAESHCNLGNALFQFRPLHEAVTHFHRAISLKPDYALAHLSLAMALRFQRRSADAEASCLAALELEANYVEALCLLGELKADRGEFAAAVELFQRAMAINPEYPSVFFSIASHRKMTTGDLAWLQGAQALLKKSQPLGSEISLHYALGKYFDDTGQFAEAFAHFRQANELTKRYGFHYDAAKLTARVDEIMARFDAAATLHRPAEDASGAELPIFIIGMPRSGTSLTEQILASHPAVFGAGEVTFWDGAFGAYRKAADDREASRNLVPVLVHDYLERLHAVCGDALRVTDKMPANFLYAGLIHRAFPRARIIHVRRHPIDTCLSIYFQNFSNMGPWVNDLDHLAHYYGQYLRITDHWRDTLPPTALLEVPYEALIEDQEGWTRRMLDFAGLPWDPKCLEFHTTDRVVITASKWQVRQKLHGASVARWKNYQQFLGPLRHLLEPP